MCFRTEVNTIKLHDAKSNWFSRLCNIYKRKAFVIYMHRRHCRHYTTLLKYAMLKCIVDSNTWCLTTRRESLDKG